MKNILLFLSGLILGAVIYAIVKHLEATKNKDIAQYDNFTGIEEQEQPQTIYIEQERPAPSLKPKPPIGKTLADQPKIKLTMVQRMGKTAQAHEPEPKECFCSAN